MGLSDYETLRLLRQAKLLYEMETYSMYHGADMPADFAKAYGVVVSQLREALTGTIDELRG